MTTILKGASLFDPEQKRFIDNSVVIINNNGRIEQAGNINDVFIPGNGDIYTYDLTGKFILPGLIDAHIHMDLQGMADTYEENLLEDNLRAIRAAKEMEKTLFSGFTTVRNVGSVNHIDFSVKKCIEKEIINGPRVLTGGKIISITCSGTEYFNGLYREAEGYDGFKEAAREQLKMGADILKVMATGAVMNPGGVPGAEQPDIHEIEGVVEEARKLNKKVAAHAHGAQGIKNAVKAGVDTIEHGTFADDESVKLMAENNVYLVPTIVVGYLMLKYGAEYGIPQFMIEKSMENRDYRLDAVRKAKEAGVKIAMGTDAGTPYNYHGKNAYEIIAYVKEGLMTPEEALVSATKTAAEACDIYKEAGTIEPGKFGDIVVVDGNPVDNIGILGDSKNIKMVFKEGKLIKNNN